jgi:hypothetical protein
MSTALNDRDAILQAASVRVINPKNASILMSASTSLFQLSADGVVSVPTTTITATLTGLEGDVTFTSDGATLTSVTGKTAVVRYVDMTGPAAIITASIVAGGQTFSQSCIIGVVRDGASGGSGARGAGMYFATANTWSDGAADAATPGGNVLGDVVTVSNGSDYSMTKRWDGSAWQVTGAIFHGSLFVTNSIHGAALKVGTVEIRKPDGTLILGAGGTLAAEAAAPGTKNSEIVVGGRNLFPDGDFERGVHTLSGAGTSVTNVSDRVGSISGTKSLFLDGTGADMWVYLGTRMNVTPGREYRISFYSKTATAGVILGSSSYILLWNGPDHVVHDHLPMDNLGVGTWKRQVVAWTCPPGVTHIEPRFGIHTNGAYSWMAIDCLQIEEGNTVTQWTPATEDIAADAQLKANAAADVAYVGAMNAASGDATSKANAARDAAIADANAKLAVKLNKGGDVLGGIFSVDTVNAPAGFRAGTLTWNTAGDYMGGYGTAMTPKGLIGYNTSGQRTFMLNGQTGDVSIRGDIMGGAYVGYAWPAPGQRGFYLGAAGLLVGNGNDGRYTQITSDGDIYTPNFSSIGRQVRVTGEISGSVIRTSVLALESARLLTPWNRLAPFSLFDSGSVYNTSIRNATVTLDGFVGPAQGAENTFHPKRFGSFKKDIFLKATMHGDVTWENLYIEMRYHDPAQSWGIVASGSVFCEGRAGISIVVRYTPSDGGWDYIAFRARTSQGRCLSLVFEVQVFNFNESVNPSGSSSGMPGGDSGGGGIGNNPEPWCVDYETTKLPDGRFAREVEVNDLMECWDFNSENPGVEYAPANKVAFGEEASTMLVTKSGVQIIQSNSTPMTVRDGRVVLTPEMLGEEVVVKRGDELVWEPITYTFDMGVRRVVKISLHDRMYFAGMDSKATIATHNLEYKP